MRKRQRRRPDFGSIDGKTWNRNCETILHPFLKKCLSPMFLTLMHMAFSFYLPKKLPIAFFQIPFPMILLPYEFSVKYIFYKSKKFYLDRENSYRGNFCNASRPCNLTLRSSSLLVRSPFFASGCSITERAFMIP